MKLLFDKARVIETSLENANMEQLFDTSDKIDEKLSSIVVAEELSDTQITTDKFEITKLEACRFVGKSVYAREHGRGSNELFKFFRETNTWVFDKLDEMKEYATDECHNAALKTWDFYTDGGHECHGITYADSGLVGYHIGRFMKPNCPKPKGMDAIDIPDISIIKGWMTSEPRDSIFQNPKFGIVYEALNQEATKQGYELTSWILMADVFSKPDENGVSHFGQYSSCRPKKEKSNA